MILLTAFILLYVTFGAFLADDDDVIAWSHDRSAFDILDFGITVVFGPLFATGYFFIWYLPYTTLNAIYNWWRKRDETWI